ncbi:MAG: molybdopterin-dependent oxidoreductase, partial [Thaumarchaeota archaeon]|nr:molybdopterin-dependent oxidoreductase [Nitrososphaerota archaeon]
MSQEAEGLPPGQYWGRKWIIYAALDIPKIRAEDWKLKLSGSVGNKLEFSYEDFLKLPMKKYHRSFHCLLPDSLVYANPEPLEIRSVRPSTRVVGRDGKLHRVR